MSSEIFLKRRDNSASNILVSEMMILAEMCLCVKYSTVDIILSLLSVRRYNVVKWT